jgi:hypothetical protein
MSNDSKRVSQLGVTTSVANNDRLVVLTNPASSAQTQTVSVNNFIRSTVNTFPVANTSQLGVVKVDGTSIAAAANGVISTTRTNILNSSTTTYTGSTVEVDLSKSIAKLTPHNNTGSPHYHIADGVEGQILHLVPATGGARSGNYTNIRFAHCRFSDANSGSPNSIYDFTDNGWWLPFQNGGTCVTIIFTDGYWNLPHNIFD